MFTIVRALDHNTALAQLERSRSSSRGVESALLNFRNSGILVRFAGACLEPFQLSLQTTEVTKKIL